MRRVRRPLVSVPQGPRGRIARAFTCPMPTCPRDGRIIQGATPRQGESWHSCAPEHRHHEGACQGHWLNIVLEPGLTTTGLAVRYGDVVARALLEATYPEVITPGGLILPAFLVGPDAADPAHLQLLTTRRDEYHHRYARLEAMLEALGLLTATDRRHAG